MNAPLKTVDGIVATEDTTSRRSVPLLTADELARLPPLAPRIKGIFPATGLAAVAGPSASGKTFLVLDQAMQIAAGYEWFGHRSIQSKVVYLGLEGQGGLAQRVRAYLTDKGRSATENIRFITDALVLTSAVDVFELEQQLRKFGAKVLIVDTLSAANPGLDENGSADMGSIIEAAKRLQSAIDGLVIWVHHTGKDASKGMRGHSSLFGAMDAVIEVSRDDRNRRWTLRKFRDGIEGETHAFRLRGIELGEDEDDDPITSCVVEPDDTPTDSIRKAAPRGGNARIAFDAIKAALKDSKQFGKGDAPPTRPTIALEAAIDAAAACLPVDPKRRRERAEAAITALVSKEYLVHLEGWIWLP